MNSPLWICDDCGGPAVWTMFDDVPHYHCELECDGFRQLALGLDDVQIDSISSVSAPKDEGEPVWCDRILEEQHQRFLNEGEV